MSIVACPLACRPRDGRCVVIDKKAGRTFQRFGTEESAPWSGSRCSHSAVRDHRIRTHRWKCTLLRGLEELGAIFEVHGIVVEPSPAPDEAVLLEDIDDLGRCIVTVGRGVF